MKTLFAYPAQKSELAEFKAANPVHKLVHSGAVVVVLTGDDIPAPPVQKCDKLQFRLALAYCGLTDQVRAHVENSDAFVQAWFEATEIFRSDNPMLLSEAENMGLADQLPAVFAVAKTMPKL